MSDLSSELNQYIRIKIGEAKSKEEEDQYVKQDIVKLKELIKIKQDKEQRIWEIILRIIYADMLGHNTEFAHSYIVNQIQHNSYKVKRIAYEACIILLGEDSPFRIMMVSSLQRDLENQCLYNKIIALNTLNKILCPLNASAFVDLLIKNLTNPQTVVKKKVILCLIKLEKIFPNSVDHFDEIMEKGLRDKEPSVMLALLPYFYEQSLKNPEKTKSLLYVFINIFQQILQQKLSKDYEYEGHSAPWSLIKILQIFTNICKDDKQNSEMIYTSLQVYLKAFTFVSTDMDLVLLYQLIMTIIQIYPNEDLIRLGVDKLEILRNNSLLKKNNTLLLILEIISKLADINKGYMQNFQMLLLDCLESEDETIKHMTIRILFKNINEQNIELVIEKIFRFILTTPDIPFKKQTVNQLYLIIEQKAPKPSWFLRQVLKILQLESEFIGENIQNSIIKNLVEIFSFEEGQKKQLVSEFLSIFHEWIENNNLVDSVINIFVWFLGEFFQYVEDLFSSENLIGLFSFILSKNFEKPETFSYILSGIKKITIKIQDQNLKRELFDLMRNLKPLNFENEIRLKEFINSTLDQRDMFKIKDQDFDLDFEFLEGFIKESIKNGGKTYQQNYSLNLATKEVKEDYNLVIKYSEEQIQKNMKKDIQDSDKIFKYRGKAKWTEGGFQENLPQQEDTIQNPKLMTFNFNEEDKKQDEKNSSKKIKNKKKKKKVSKKEGLKSKIAQDLFGGTTFTLNSKKNDMKFLEQNISLKKPIEFIDQGKVQDIDFLEQNNDVKVTQFEPLHINLNDYEEKWENFENQENQFKIQKLFQCNDLEHSLRQNNILIIERNGNELICACKNQGIQEDEGCLEIIQRGGDKEKQKKLEQIIRTF